MNKFKSKKGFTLAELLIVVAIIAILVAIAVPLFVGSLTKAQEARDNANVRAVRGAATVYLLEHSGEDVWYTTADTTKTLAKAWQVTAYTSANGEITNLKVTAASTDAESGNFTAKGTISTDGDGFKIELLLKQTEVGKLTDKTT